MSYVVATRPGRWEIRESRLTDRGPRSRSLATFAELTDEVIEHARGRSEKPLDSADLRRACLRAGAPVREPRADRSARELLGELAEGRAPRGPLRRLLADALREEPSELSDQARAAADWIAATPEQRGEALHDLLSLGDHLPVHRRAGLRFPRLGATQR